MTGEELVARARTAADGAHAPYSQFRVGAAVLASDGRVFSSANVENAAYPSSQCAEANAINYAVSQGAGLIEAVAVVCVDAVDVDGAYPCGRCRQIMSEFDIPTVYVSASGPEFRRHTLDELLPFRFSL